MSPNTFSTLSHTQNIYSHPGDGRVNTHIDHLLIYRSSKHCKQQHGFFCFHKIHTQFIHLLEANQCVSVDVEHISLTYSIKTDRVVIQAYIKAGKKLRLNCERYGIQIYFHSWKQLHFEYSSEVNVSLDYIKTLRLTRE